MLEHLEAALRLAKGEKDQRQPAKTTTSGQIPFSKKYEKSAAEYVVRLLSKRPGLGLSQNEIMETLANDGKNYTFQSMAYSVDRLTKKGIVTKSQAPEGSKARFIYKIERSKASSFGG